VSEVEWVKTFSPSVEIQLRTTNPKLNLWIGRKLPYANEVRSYKEDGIAQSDYMGYETDLLVTEEMENGEWTPRVIIEAKCRGSITTHDAITYSHKASTHRQVHPYLRYGILIGERGNYPLPGRLFRHGTQFDFMLSWVGKEPTNQEIGNLVEVLLEEVSASQTLEEIIFESRKKGRKHYTMLHKQLKVR